MAIREPAISVLMGVLYRRPGLELLERSVMSVLEQTRTDLELLICDDGSPSDACAWLEEAARRDSRVRLVRKGDLLGLAEKLNACLRQARGRYIARMDDDDYSHRDRLARQVRYLEEHPEAAFVGCNVDLWRDGRVLGVRRLPERPCVRDFYFVQPFVHPTLVFRREALEAVGGYSTDRHCFLCEDYDLLLRLYEKDLSGVNLQECLFDYTLSADPGADRRMCHRWNETVTRWRRFRELGRLPGALPYVVKPLAVGLIPREMLRRIKNGRMN